jgi:hypothetical protein
MLGYNATVLNDGHHVILLIDTNVLKNQSMIISIQFIEKKT